MTANAKYPVPVSVADSATGEETEEVQWLSGSRPATGKDYKSMHLRMNRKV